MEDSLIISTRNNDKETLILDLRGKIIGSWALHLGERIKDLKESGVRHVILNFQEVVSIDSLGVMAIASAVEMGLQVKILHPNSTCSEVLQRHQVNDTVEIFFREEDALKSVGSIPPSFSERRVHKRIDTNIPVEIEYKNNRLRGILLNLSEGGALLGYLDPLLPMDSTMNSAEESAAILPPGTIRMSLKLPFLGVIELAGESVGSRRTSEMNTLGIKLLHNEKSRHVIQRMCEEPSISLPPET
jgi:anti-anti-sigma regulatory factor